MQEQKPTAQFEPVRDAHGTGWNIRVIVPDGRRPFVLGFETEAKAREWIEHAAQSWFEQYNKGQKR